MSPTTPVTLPTDPTVTVAVVGICSAAHIRRCLEALASQEGAPAFDVVVAYDPHVPNVPDLQADFPEVRLVANEGQRNPLELASLAIGTAEGDVICLTEDHCIPRADWVRTMVAAQQPGRAVVGGRVEVRPGTSATDWAFYFVDFFRYAAPVDDGPSPTLTVCNVSYKRAELDQVREVWEKYFHETAINDTLRRHFGDLWLVQESEVTMKRNVTFSDAIYERYAFGRLFGCTRIEFCSPGRRLYYAIFAPLLPVILMARMTGKALQSGKLFRAYLRALFPLTTMVLWWSWGEWMGYVTGKHPGSLVVAPEIRAATRADAAGTR